MRTSKGGCTYEDHIENPCRPLCGGAHGAGGDHHISVLRRRGPVLCGVCWRDLVGNRRFYRGADNRGHRLPCYRVPDLSLWAPGHRGLAD